MPATERITLQSRSEAADKIVTDLVTIGGRLVEVNQFSATGEELTTQGIAFQMKYTPKIAEEEDNIDAFTVGGALYKLTDKKRDRKYFTITGERTA